MYVIKTQRLAAYLMLKGFNLERTEPHKDNPNRNIFLFKQSNELLKAITEYTKQQNNQK